MSPSMVISGVSGVKEIGGYAHCCRRRWQRGFQASSDWHKLCSAMEQADSPSKGAGLGSDTLLETSVTEEDLGLAFACSFYRTTYQRCGCQPTRSRPC